VLEARNFLFPRGSGNSGITRLKGRGLWSDLQKKFLKKRSARGERGKSDEKRTLKKKRNRGGFWGGGGGLDLVESLGSRKMEMGKNTFMNIRYPS